MTEAEARTIERLRAGAGTYACGGYLAALDGLQRTEICTALIFDRLQRKMRTVETLHGEADGNWNQTFYLLYFRTLGDRQNQEAYLRAGPDASPTKSCCANGWRRMPSKRCFSAPRGCWRSIRDDAYTLDLAPQFRISGGQIRHRADGGFGAGQLDGDSPGQPPRTAAGAGRGVLRAGRVRHGTRHGLPHGGGRSGGSSASKRPRITGARTTSRESQSDDRPKRIGDVQGQHHRNQPRRRPAIRLRKLHRQRTLCATAP